MFEGVVAGILNRFLGKYVQDLDTENLNVGIFSGDVNLTDLKLKPEALYELDLPIDVKIGTVGRVNLQIPWAGLYTQPVIVNIEDVLILVGPAISNTFFDPEREKRLTRAAKRKILQDLESEYEMLSGPKNFFENLFTAIVNNIQFYVRNVHIRFEDSISSKDGPLACGFCLQSLSIETTNSKWKPAVTPANATTVYQMMRIESLSVYWNPNATVLDDAETANITPMQYYNWKHYMITGLDKFSMHHEEFEFLIKPVTCKVKLIMSRSGEARVPRLLLDAVLQDSALQLSRRQYLSVANLANSFQNISINRKYRHLHPKVSVSKDIKKWWKYAFNVVVEQRVKPYTWKAIKTHRQNYQMYLKTYKNTLRSPNDIELKMDLQKCEDSLPIISVVIAREQAKFELLSQEPERIEVVESEFDWWKPSSPGEGDTDVEDVDIKSKVELCVKTGKSKTFWSHLSSPEKKKICELIGYAEGAPRQDKPKQYIEHKLNLTLANCSLSLMNRSKEVLVMTLTQFLVSLETRPSAKAYKLSARAESMVIEGLSAENDMVPMLTAERAASTTTCHFLSVDFEKNPLNSEADYGFSCCIEPVEIVYNEHACTELINFFQTCSMTSEDLVIALTQNIEKATGVSKSVLVYAISRKKVFNVNVDIKGPCILLPEHGCTMKSGTLMVIDVSRIIIKSDLQPSNLALEDATCMELEERLYDRLHAEFCCQIIFCNASAPWRDTRRLPDSELHLLPRMKTQLVFSNSIKKDYKLLPKYKLNISISSLKLNLSEKIIGQLLDFYDNLPLPAPNTVPVSFLDSGDYAEEEVHGEFYHDKVVPDPGYKELVKLRQKIVHAYLCRNRAAESKFDKSSARLGFQEADTVFVSSEHSDEDMEVFARSVELPGFDDNVSASNNINTLLRFLIGEIVINLSLSSTENDKPYIMFSLTKLCLDIALMAYGPALQLSLSSVLVTDKLHHSNSGQYLEVLSSDPKEDVLNLLYRKVRAECPEFRSHFHSVEQALVTDIGPMTALLQADALSAIGKYLHVLYAKIESRWLTAKSDILLPKSKHLWKYMMKPEADPPVPPGATKFSYSVRLTSLTMRLSHLESNLIEVRLSGMESDFVFKANDRMIFKLFLNTLHVDDLAEFTLYPKLVYPDDDKVLEVKYVRHSSRVCGSVLGDVALKTDGVFKMVTGKMHVCLLFKILHQLQQFLEPLIPQKVGAHAANKLNSSVSQQLTCLRTTYTRLTLDIQIHAPTLLMPQKASSPNLLVINLGDLLIENFFKELSSTRNENASPNQNPVIDNILIKLNNVMLSRAVMTLAGTLEVQEPILEPVCVRCDVKRVIGQLLRRDVLLYEADLIADNIIVHLGQKDLATILAVYNDNYGEGQYIGNISQVSPTEGAQSDSSVKKLQAFFAQGDPVRKEAVFRLSMEGIEVKLYTDMDEVLSSPVRDLNHGLAKVCLGEMSAQLECFSDKAMEMRASLQSVLVEDVRPDPTILIKRVLSGRSISSRAGCVSVRGAPVTEICVTVRHTNTHNTHTHISAAFDTLRLNISLPFSLLLLRTIMDALPGSRTLSGGIVNHGYVCDAPGKRTSPAHFTQEETNDYYAQAQCQPEDAPGLSISIQFRKPEVMFFTDLQKSDSNAILLKAELLIDYSRHSNTESFVTSLVGLQIMSKQQSALSVSSPQLILKPCDVEFSRCFKSADEGVRVKMAVSDIDLHLSANTMRTVVDLLEEINNELTLPEEKEPFNFVTYAKEKTEEELWSPKKMTPYVGMTPEGSYTQPRYPSSKPKETFTMNVHGIKVLLEIERHTRVPVVMVNMTTDVLIHDWSKQIRGKIDLSLMASYYNEKLDVWEPLIEPVVQDENIYRPWNVSVKVFQSKAYPLSSKLESGNTETEAPTSKTDSKSKKFRRTGFESETSCEEGDTDNEMVFIRNPNADVKNPIDLNAANNLFVTPFGGDDSDSENENGLMDRLSMAIGHLFTDESSADEYTNEEDSSVEEQSETEDAVADKPVSFVDGNKSAKKKKDRSKTVTMKDPLREDSIDSGLETEGCVSPTAIYIICECPILNVSVTPEAAIALWRVCSPPLHVTTQAPYTLSNYIGAGSTVHLVTRAETDLAGNDRILAIADYDVDTSRPSTPGCDTSASVLDDNEREECDNIEDEWSCFEGGFTSPPTCPNVDTTSLLQKLTDQRLIIKMTDFDQLTVVCPQRAVNKLHVLHPCRNNTRYYIVIETSISDCSRKIVVRSPLQIRNETSYALELYYKKTDLLAVGVDLIGDLTNPFDDKMRLAIIAPDDTYNVPLYVAYHCKLYLLPSNFESYQTATQGVSWAELAGDLGTARDVICPAKDTNDRNIFAMRILTKEGCQPNKVTRAIPNYLLRVLPPLAFYNRLPYAIEISIQALNYKVRIEAGERIYTYIVNLLQAHRIHVNIFYMEQQWSGSFNLTPDVDNKKVNMTPDSDVEGGNKKLFVAVKVERNESWEVYVHAPYWIINKTGLPLQLKSSGSDIVYNISEQAVLGSNSGASVRIRAHHSEWSRAFRPLLAPGLVVCRHRERATSYRLLLTVTLSELCPQLTKIVTVLPYFLVYNETKRHLRFMEQNETADLWMDLAPGECTQYWPLTDSMMVHCKLRDSPTVSQHFPVTINHFTVLRMDKGSAISVEVTGGTDTPFTITFKPYSAGDAPVRVENLCEDVFLKLHQIDSGQVALLSPSQSMLYTWDDPAKERTLIWNVYNNKGKGFIADFSQDGYGEQKVSFNSVKHSTLVGTNSVTSKLSSTFKRLTPKSPEPGTSSSDDSDSVESDTKPKKVRRDKIVVYWVSFMDGYQRVFTLVQEQSMAQQYRMRINSERSNYEMYLALKGISLSVCVPAAVGVKELTHVSVTDSLPRWEVHVSNKWKILSPEIAKWIEERYKSNEKCQLKDYIHIDLEKMQMTKPFFAELRRTYNPGFWMQLRKSDTHTYMHLKMQRLQIDNQLHEAIFPSVLYPAPLSSSVRGSPPPKSCIEIAVLKQQRPSLNQDVYKYVKVAIQEYCINLDRGFVNYVFDILNQWRVEEKPAVRLRADLALVHMPIKSIAASNERQQRNVVFEHVHLSPLTVALSLSSKDYSEDGRTPKGRLSRKENRPKLFNSDLLEFLFNSWGSSLCDMKDVKLRMSNLEIRNAPITLQSLIERASQHYWTQLVQQFYVLILGLKILGNPYSAITDFTRGFKDAFNSNVECNNELISSRLCSGVTSLLGYSASAANAIFSEHRDDDCTHLKSTGASVCEIYGNDIPAVLVSSSKHHAASVTLALTGLLAAPTIEAYRSVHGDVYNAVRCGVESSGGRLVARVRLPRHCRWPEGLQPYSVHCALGVQLLRSIARGHFSDTDLYLAHCYVNSYVLLLTTKHMFLVRGGSSGWLVEWRVSLDDMMGVPVISDNALIIHVKQNELVNFFSTDEKVITFSEPTVLKWIREKVECALLLNLEDKPCPPQM